MYLFLDVYICMYIYIYMYTCIYVYMYICIYVYMYVCICVHMYVYIYIYIHIHACMHAYVHMTMSTYDSRLFCKMAHDDYERNFRKKLLRYGQTELRQSSPQRYITSTIHHLNHYTTSMSSAPSKSCDLRKYEPPSTWKFEVIYSGI